MKKQYEMPEAEIVWVNDVITTSLDPGSQGMEWDTQ